MLRGVFRRSIWCALAILAVHFWLHADYGGGRFDFFFTRGAPKFSPPVTGTGTMALLLLFVLMLPTAGAVTCLSCNDGIPGCQGGRACPMFRVPFVNGEILRTEAGQHTEMLEGEGEEEGEEVVHTLLTVSYTHLTLPTN